MNGWDVMKNNEREWREVSGRIFNISVLVFFSRTRKPALSPHTPQHIIMSNTNESNSSRSFSFSSSSPPPVAEFQFQFSVSRYYSPSLIISFSADFGLISCFSSSFPCFAAQLSNPMSFFFFDITYVFFYFQFCI